MSSDVNDAPKVDEGNSNAPLMATPPIEAAAGSATRIKIGSQRDPESVATALEDDGATSSVVAETTTAAPTGPIPKPTLRDPLSPELEQQLSAAMDDVSMEEMLQTAATNLAAQGELEPEARVSARVVTIHGDNVFFDLGVRHQGLVPAKQFKQLPEAGSALEVIVARFDPEEGLYHLSVPGAAAARALPSAPNRDYN